MTPFTLGESPETTEADVLRAEITDLRSRLLSAQVVRTADTTARLCDDIIAALPQFIREEVEIITGEDSDGDLTITLCGVEETITGTLALKVREFEVEGTMTVPVVFTVRARDEDEARDAAEEIMRDAADECRVGYVDHEHLDGEVSENGMTDTWVDTVSER